MVYDPTNSVIKRAEKEKDLKAKFVEGMVYERFGFAFGVGFRIRKKKKIH